MTALQKPNLGVATIQGGEIGVTGSRWKIKTVAAAFDHSVGISETTGDGDSDHTYHTNDLIRGSFQLRGYVVAGSAIGIANLKSQRDSSDDPVTTMTFVYSNERQFTDREIMIERVQLSYRESSEFIGIVIAGRFTDTPASDTWESAPA